MLATAAWYAATMFLILQGADLIVPALHLPGSINTILVLAALIGFPVTLLFSWFFDVKRDPTDEVDETPASFHDARRVIAIAVVLFVAVIAAALITQYGRVRSLLGATTVKCEDGSAAPCTHTLPMNPEAYVVLPFADETPPANDINGDLAARLVTEGLQSWQDMTIADPLRVSDALRMRSSLLGHVVPVDSGIVIARSVGAGRLIMGDVWRFADTTRVRATVYDLTAGGRALKWREVRYQSGTAAGATALRRLADALLLAGTQLESSVGQRPSSTSLGALLAYDQAMRAITKWDLQRASQQLDQAIALDTSFVPARFWLAQVELWSADTTNTWRANAAFVAGRKSALAKIDGALADAMAALAERDYPKACSLYRQALAADSLSFAAWFGLGDCQSFDAAVISDSKSVSGWSFRGSNQAALTAYRRALALVPSFNFAFRSSAASRIDKVLVRSHTTFRRGRGLVDTVRFAARPDLVADTLAYVPFPYADFARGAPQTWPANQRAALERNRRTLRDMALDWARSYPSDPKALEALSLALESLGAVSENAPIEQSALLSNREAQRLTTDNDANVRLAVAEVRQLVKANEFRAASDAAAKALRRWPQPTPRQAAALAALASLTGRAGLMADLLERSATTFEPDVPVTGEEVDPPLAVSAATLRLLAYASFAAPMDSLRVLHERARRTLVTYVPASEREVVYAATLERAARMLYFTLGPDDAHRSNRPTSSLIIAQRALSRGDTTAARAELAKLAGIRRGWWPGENAIDGTLSEVEIYLAVHDTAGAIRQMDGLLGSLWTITPYHFNQPYQPAALVRLMKLRARVAMQRGDTRTAAHWNEAVRELWNAADRAVVN